VDDPLVVEFEVGVASAHAFDGFLPAGAGTLVRLEQSGWERLGEAGAIRRTRTEHAWGVIVESFSRACEG
jgi:hypothetical protein